MNMNSQQRIEVSIICNTYNHEKYIRDTLEGFMMQKTSFGYEVLIHDDASTDKTADIIREYEKKYPEIIKPIYETENQYAKQDGSIGRIQHKRALGKYIAYCEGDDYWIDPYKLQKQYDAMEAHPEVDMCAHGAYAYNTKKQKIIYNICPKKNDVVIPVNEVITGGGAYVATNSLFYRKELNDNKPPFRQILTLDYTLQIHGSLRGGLLYLSDIMSVYRVMTPGSWSMAMDRDNEKYKNHVKKVIRSLEQLDVDTEQRYHDTIVPILVEERWKTLDKKKQFFALFTHEFVCYKKTLSRKKIVYLFVKIYFPWVNTIYGKIKNGK